MNQLADSLLKYGNPVLVKTINSSLPKGPPLGVKPQQSADSRLISTPLRLNPILFKSDMHGIKEILDAILPPREWTEGNQLWMQPVSRAACTRADVIKLKEHLDTKLQQKQASLTGICSVRRELYSQCFDELIRQETISCAERGLLLLRVRDEINLTMAAYQTQYESKEAFDIRKALQFKLEKYKLKQQISDLEYENKLLRMQLDEQKKMRAKIYKKQAGQLDAKLFIEQIRLLKEAKERLKAKLVDWQVRKTE